MLRAALTFPSHSMACCKTKQDYWEFLVLKHHFLRLKAPPLIVDLRMTLFVPLVVSFDCPSLVSPHSEVQKGHLDSAVRCLLV